MRSRARARRHAAQGGSKSKPLIGNRLSFFAKDEESEHRHVHFNRPGYENVGFCNNHIRTALYTWRNFLIKGLLIEEFPQKGPNMYFALVAFLQFHPETTNTKGVPFVGGVLAVIVLYSCYLKIKQDLQRHRADREANNAKCRRLVGGKFVPGVWTDVAVGDFLLVKNRESLPADMVLFCAHEADPNDPQASSRPRARARGRGGWGGGERETWSPRTRLFPPCPSSHLPTAPPPHAPSPNAPPIPASRLPPQGRCQVETKSLDGETNLKPRYVPRMLCRATGGTLDAQTAACARVGGHVTCEQPNAATTKFAGTIELEGDGDDSCPILITNVLLRGSTVRNTEYVIGLVVNTGNDTKVMQGSVLPPTKRSRIDRAL